MKEEIKTFLAANAGVNKDWLVDDLDLFEKEVWDSLLIVRFFVFAQNQFGIKIDLASVREDDIRTVPAIVNLLNHPESLRG